MWPLIRMSESEKLARSTGHDFMLYLSGYFSGDKGLRRQSYNREYVACGGFNYSV